MSYSQSMEHWKNHRKDRFFQPCYGPVHYTETNKVAVDSEMRITVETMKQILAYAHEFPIYLAMDRLGRWELVARNHIYGTEINSHEELLWFAETYVFSEVNTD